MKNILVPISSNENALNTLQYAINFAKQSNAKIYLVHIFSSTKISGSFVKIDNILERDSKKILDDLLAKVDRKDVSILRKSLKGHSIVDSIGEFCKIREIDLIITSTKNDESDKTVFLGEVTGGILKDLSFPVLVIPSSASFKPIDKILMAIKSGKIQSEKTLFPVFDIKTIFNSKIDLLQVKTPLLDEKDLALNTELKNNISNLISTKNATVFQGVLEFLHAADPDIICVIKRKRGFFRKLWQNDTVKKIDFESNIPLLVLKGIS
ncbi:MAG: universal stress protein [Bacteroidota bacterium]